MRENRDDKKTSQTRPLLVGGVGALLSVIASVTLNLSAEAAWGGIFTSILLALVLAGRNVTSSAQRSPHLRIESAEGQFILPEELKPQERHVERAEESARQ